MERKIITDGEKALAAVQHDGYALQYVKDEKIFNVLNGKIGN